MSANQSPFKRAGSPFVIGSDKSEGINSSSAVVTERSLLGVPQGTVLCPALLLMILIDFSPNKFLNIFVMLSI